MRESVTLSHASRFGPWIPRAVRSFARPRSEVSGFAYSSKIRQTVFACSSGIREETLRPSTSAFESAYPYGAGPPGHAPREAR